MGEGPDGRDGRLTLHEGFFMIVPENEPKFHRAVTSGGAKQTSTCQRHGFTPIDTIKAQNKTICSFMYLMSVGTVLVKQGQGKWTAWDIFHRFLFEDRICSIVLSLSLLLLWVTIFPTLEKILTRHREISLPLSNGIEQASGNQMLTPTGLR